MDHLQIPFGSQIAIRSNFNQKYMGFRHQTQQVACCFPPPSVYGAQKVSEPIDTSIKLRIMPREGEKSTLVQEGSRVYLINSFSEDYLTCTSKGELKFDKKSLNEEMNKMLFKSASWTISFAASQKALTSPTRAPLSPYDCIVLKSVYGAYLTIQALTSNCEAISEMDQQRSVWNIHLANVTMVPQWLFERSAFGKYIKPQYQIPQGGQQRRNLRSNPQQIQQSLLVEDLLDVMLGFQGAYIKRKPESSFFVIQPHLDTPSCNVSLAQLTYRILELPSHYERLMKFIHQLQLKQSTLSQALCDGLRTLISQYKDLVVQLDDEAENGLTLQGMWFIIQNSLKVMRGMSDLVTAASSQRGGQLLSCLLRMINENTDSHVVSIYQFLFNKLIALYANMLSQWIYNGVVDDRFGEFMILVEQNAQGEWNYWQQKFSLRNEQIPSLFQRDAKNILVTGKYLNILKACKKQIKHPCAGEIQKHLDYHLSRQNFTDPIQKAYDWANEQLLQLVYKESHLMEVLQSLKGYYFLRFGDLFVHFLDAAEQELSQKKMGKSDSRQKQFSVQKLQNLFQLNVRVSSAANDELKQDVSCRLDNATIFEQVHRIKTLESEQFNFDFSEKPFIKKDSRYVDFVTLDYKCSFPLNLILNKKSISKYQALFRLMLWCKFLQRQLGSLWTKLQSIKQMGILCFQKAYILNHRMLNFVKSMIYYFAQEVIEQNWFKLITNLKRAQNFQKIIQKHDQFLNNCLKESLLINSKLLPILTAQIGNTINNHFALKNYLSKIQEQLSIIKQDRPTDPSQRRKYLQYMRGTVNELVEQNKITQFVTQSSNAFESVMLKFVRQISLGAGKQQQHLMRLGQMLDEQNYVHKKSSNYYT